MEMDSDDDNEFTFIGQENGQIGKEMELELNEAKSKIAELELEKELRDEKIAKMEMELKVSKLEMENKMLQEKLRQKEIVDEMREATQKKVAELEKHLAEARREIFVGEEKHQKLEIELKQGQKQQQQNNAPHSAMDTLQEKLDKLETDQKQQQQKNTEEGSNRQLSNKNCWDVSSCHEEIAISGHDRSAIALLKGKGTSKYWWRSVFAKHSAADSAVYSPDIFYFEITVKQIQNAVFFGFTDKRYIALNGHIEYRNGTYAYENYGYAIINGSFKSKIERFGTGDTVGFGANFGTKRLFFTKNGRRIDPPNDLCIASALSADRLFPFISLFTFDVSIEANFGPNFLFNLSALSAGE